VPLIFPQVSLAFVPVPFGVVQVLVVAGLRFGVTSFITYICFAQGLESTNFGCAEALPRDARNWLNLLSFRIDLLFGGLESINCGRIQGLESTNFSSCLCFLEGLNLLTLDVKRPTLACLSLRESIKFSETLLHRGLDSINFGRIPWHAGIRGVLASLGFATTIGGCRKCFP
jgi:hypothetical protein